MRRYLQIMIILRSCGFQFRLLVVVGLVVALGCKDDKQAASVAVQHLYLPELL
jgi:hypothetical protein